MAKNSKMSRALNMCGKVVSYTVLTVIALCILLSSILFSALFEERETVSVPNVVGMTLDEAMETMQNHFLRVKINRVNTEDLTEKGVVVSQTKTPGSVVKVDYTVVLNVGKGPVSDKITDFSGWDIDDVEPFLKAYQSQLTLLYPLSYVVNNHFADVIGKHMSTEVADGFFHLPFQKGIHHLSPTYILHDT